MKKVLLCGYMGSGKTTVGKIVADKAGIAFLDLDSVIEQESGLSVSQIFAQNGEIHFRKIEHNAFSDLMKSDQDFVLSLGGGTPAYANNHLLMNAPGAQSFYLRASIDTLFSRLASDNASRPLIARKSEEELKEHIAKNLFDRSYFYNQATHVISIDGKSAEAIAGIIFGKLA